MGSLRLIFFMAFKSIVRGNHWALAGIIAVMSLSFINLNYTSSILAGVNSTFDKQLVSLLTANIVIAPEENKYYLEQVSQTQDVLRQVPGVAGVSAQLRSSALFEYRWKEKARDTDKGKSGNWEVIGIDPKQEASVTNIHGTIVRGAYLDAGDRDSILVGVDIAGGNQSSVSSFQNLGGAGTGEKVRLTYPGGVIREYTIKGVFKANQPSADRTAFVIRSEVVSALDRSVFADRASQVLVKLERTGTEAYYAEAFRAMGIKGRIRPWQEYGGSTHSITSSFTTVASLIGIIGLVVAAIVLYIVIYINVVNRKRQIGIMRAIGIGRRVVVGSYLVQAIFYAASGIGFGWALMNFVVQPYYVSHPLRLPIGEVSLLLEAESLRLSIAGLIAAAVMAGFFPVISIVRQSIIKAIWGNG